MQRLITPTAYSGRIRCVREKKRKIFLILEGEVTEKKYFDCLFEKYCVTDFVPLYSNAENHISNPYTALKKFLADKNNEISLTYHEIYNFILEYCKTNGVIIEPKSVSEKINDYAIAKGSSMDKIFNHELVDEFQKYMNDYFKTIDISVFLSSKDIEELMKFYSYFDDDVDKIFVVCDRDRKSFVEKQFNEIIEISKKNQYINVFLTNPCIEFWFLLHFVPGKSINAELMKENVKTGDKTYAFIELKKQDSTYTKTNFDPNKYYLLTDAAIQNASFFSSNLVDLKDNIGTNLPELINILKEK